VNEAVNGYIGIAQHRAFPVVPLGTGNDFAKMLGVGKDWQLACERIAATRETRRRDAATATHSRRHRRRVRRAGRDRSERIR
jgi:diacylglycerol kinase family enzyme